MHGQQNVKNKLKIYKQNHSESNKEFTKDKNGIKASSDFLY